MVARIWHGKTRIEHYVPYSDFLNKTAIPDYKKSAGFRELTFLRNIANGVANFTLITYWDSLEAIESFAGPDFEKAKYYAEDKNYLLDFEEKVQHFEVFASQKTSTQV